MNSVQSARRRGVTLIETIMVIALLAAAATTSLLLMDGQWIAKREVTAVSNDTANALITARNTAITSQAIVRVRRERNSGGTQLTIIQDPGPFRSGHQWTMDLGSDAQVSGSPTEIQFTPMGTANRSLKWKIAQSRTSGEVTVSPASGQVLRRLP
ncbi:MAG: Tfp pilus assembly protein FimT/FimU [Rubripirellula sp.]